MRTQSESAIVSTYQGVASLSLRSWNTVGQLDDKNTKDKWEKKKVKFDNCVRVVLIASKSEYINSGLGTVLWYSADDYSKFKEEALCEYKTLMSNSSLNKKEALNELYQVFEQIELDHFDGFELEQGDQIKLEHLIAA